ncbi:MAG: alpha/beta hydrolase [Xanthobacteraceae bacterium]|nr:alpha/beta hydrolase [Xanthobacteraceae bacterium]
MAVMGSGQPLFLFHSLLSDRASFDAIAPQLAKSFRVFVPELPGFGLSQTIDGGLIDIADRMAQAVREASGKQKPIMLGNGYGGFVALQMAIRHPSLVDRLVLADCGAAFSEPGRQAFRNMDAAASSKGLTAILNVAMRRLFAPEFQDRNSKLMADRREAFLATKPAVFSQACKALSELDLRPQLGSVKIPTLVLVGEHDEATPPPMSQELAAGLPDARLKILHGCAHVPQLQAPDVFLAAIGDFIATRVTA